MSASYLNVETDDTFASLLELASNNDVQGFKKFMDREPSSVDEFGLWYGRQNGSSQMVLQQLTPLMVAATYGSIDVLKLILPRVDVNRNCGVDNSTALHCAASGGSINSVDAVKLLLAAGADPNLTDANGRRPFDVIAVSPRFQALKYSLQMMLTSLEEDHRMRVSTNLESPPLSPECAAEKKEYPVDPTLPDIKNSIYSTDEFRMFSFKVRPCSRAYSHDWTECPFVHPGENARRRDPRKYHYSCVPCPDFRKGACRRGDMCEYAHGVFECWLHPAQYRTRLCKDGTSCNRRVCFFAHTQEELRPLYVRSAMDFAAAMSLLPGSPSPFTLPMSPSQQNVPALHLPGSNFQSSRLRSSFSARDIPPQDLNDIQQQQQQQQQLPLLSISTNRCVRLEDTFSAESLSPRYSDQVLASAVLNQFNQQQSMLSPIKTTFSPRNVDLLSPFGVPSPISPMSARVSMLARQEKQFRSLSSRDLGSNALEDNWSHAEWGIGGGDELKRSLSFELLNNGEEPDLSWVHSLVKESPQDKSAARVLGTATSSAEGADSNNNIEQVEQSVLGSWLEQMQLDQLMAQ